MLAVEEEEEEEEEEPAPKPAAKKQASGAPKQFQGTSTESSGPSPVALALKAVGAAAFLGGSFFAVRPLCLKRQTLQRDSLCDPRARLSRPAQECVSG